MEYTEKYKLKKPGQDDFYNIEDQNQNMDSIEKAFLDFLKKLGSKDISKIADGTVTGAINKLANSSKVYLDGEEVEGTIELVTTQEKEKYHKYSDFPLHFYGYIAVCDNGLYFLNNNLHKLYKFDGVKYEDLGEMPGSYVESKPAALKNEVHFFENNPYGSGGHHYKWDGVLWTEMNNTFVKAGVVYDSTVFKNEIHMFAKTDHYKYNAGDDSWTKVSTTPFTFSSEYKCATFKNEIHVICKGKHYSWNGSTWKSVGKGITDYKNCSFEICATNDEMHVFGWYENKKHFKYDGNSWVEIPYKLPYSPSESGFVCIENEIHMFGGEDQSNEHYNLNHRVKSVHLLTYV